MTSSLFRTIIGTSYVCSAPAGGGGGGLELGGEEGGENGRRTVGRIRITMGKRSGSASMVEVDAGWY